MTTILTINGVSTLLVAAGLGALLLRRTWRVRAAQVQPVYVTSRDRRDPHA